jgi:hypothetical protein
MLTSLEEYEHFIYTIRERCPSIFSSTLVLIRRGIATATIKGEVTFENDITLVVAEAITFARGRGRITRYGYEVWQGGKKLYWYDAQPHPGDPHLAETHPHHKHIPPDIKRNRMPAPRLSFEKPNLPFLIEEIERELLLAR